jgi:hypothetical protein
MDGSQCISCGSKKFAEYVVENRLEAMVCKRCGLAATLVLIQSKNLEGCVIKTDLAI